ncbi:MAG TPA: amidohydrolase [Acidimicrobiales bacterium]|nr:amidohydrolase [Acidimicrobiales bacterium]
MTAPGRAELASLRRHLHRHPETAFDVDASAGLVAERLAAAGLDVTRGVGGSGVVATLRRGTSSRSIGLRADLDALPIQEANTFDHRSQAPGAFHGCGHDGHTTMLLGAALHLAADTGPDSSDIDGTVHFVFQPDEENGRGAQAMIDDGLLERFPMDAVYGMHNLPGLAVGRFATRSGPFTAYEERFEIEIHGRGGHASAPERTIDPLVAGAHVVIGLQSIVSRALAPQDHGVVSVTELITDGAPNIIPTTVTIRGDVRGYEEHVSEAIRSRMGAIVEGTAAAHGATATLRYARAFEPTVNTAAEVDVAARAVGGVAGAGIDTDHAPMGFSEDFAQFLQHRPGCFILIGNGTEGCHGATLHNPHYDFNDDALPFGVAYWTALVRDVLATVAPPPLDADGGGASR